MNISAFPPCFVISLPESAQRRAYITRHFADHDLPFSFYDAVDGRRFDVLTQPVYDPRRILFFGKHLTGGEIGCLLSHKSILEKIVAENIPSAFVFEDDVILRPDFKKVAQSLAGLNAPLDIVRFLGSEKVSKLRQRDVYPLCAPYRITRLSTTPGGAHAYYVTLAGAKKLLKHLDKTMYPIDTMMGRTWQTGIANFTVQPGLAIQDLGMESSIGEARFDKKNKFTGPMKYLFPALRGYIKFCELIGKQWTYRSTVFQDRAALKKSMPRTN